MNSNPKSWHHWSVTLRKLQPLLRLLRRSAQVCLAAVLVAVFGPPATLYAQRGLSDPVSEEDRFVEKQVPMPAYPQVAALLRFPTDRSMHAVLIDERTLAIGEDGVVRYVLVVRSPSGAKSVSFEGLRCATGERRTYAYGRKAGESGTWSAARNPDWTMIADRGINRYYFEFWRDVFCDGKQVVMKREILENLKRGGRERPLGTPSE